MSDYRGGQGNSDPGRRSEGDQTSDQPWPARSSYDTPRPAAHTYRTVWKFTLQPDVTPIIGLVNPIIRLVGNDPAGDGYLPSVWIEHTVGDTAKPTMIRLAMIGTGHTIGANCSSHVGSVVTPSGLVWHIYHSVDTGRSAPAPEAQADGPR